MELLINYKGLIKILIIIITASLLQLASLSHTLDHTLRHIPDIKANPAQSHHLSVIDRRR